MRDAEPPGTAFRRGIVVGVFAATVVAVLVASAAVLVRARGSDREHACARWDAAAVAAAEAASLPGATGTADLAAFIETDATLTDIARIRAAIEVLDGVSDVDFESQQQAYESFKQLFKDQPELLHNVRPNQLPASFRIRVRAGTDTANVARSVETVSGVTAVKDEKERYAAFRAQHAATIEQRLAAFRAAGEYVEDGRAVRRPDHCER